MQLLTFLGAPKLIDRTLDLMGQLGPEPIPDWAGLVERSADYGGTVQNMLKNMPPLSAIHYAFVLRSVDKGWSLDQRRKYFTFIQNAAKYPGGVSYTGFLDQIREDALAKCSTAERVILEPIVTQSLHGEPFLAAPPLGPGRKWTKQSALEVLGGKLDGPSPHEGRNLFYAASCAKCHRYNGEGGAIGPDLSTAARKFSVADLVESIVEPSKVISDQYQSYRVQTVDGKVIVGRVVEIADELHVYTDQLDAPPEVIRRSDVEEMTVSTVSQMPSGLIDALNPDELKALIAYLRTSGS